MRTIPTKADIDQAVEEYLRDEASEMEVLNSEKIRHIRQGADFVADFVLSKLHPKNVSHKVGERTYKAEDLIGNKYAIICTSANEWKRIQQLTGAKPEGEQFPYKKYNIIDTLTTSNNYGSLTWYRKEKFVVIKSEQVVD